jgi:hypothetical protein
MANYASAKVVFEGNQDQLEKVKNLVITKGRFSEHAIDFSYVKPMLPGVRDKQLFELFGCDWDNFVMKKYTPEEKEKYTQKVEALIKREGWIGFRDNYINDSSRDASAEYKDDKLVIKAEFSWYCPTLFFAKVAEDFGLNVKVLEFVEGNNTVISYIDSKGKCIDVVNNAQNIIENQEFRNYAIELDLHKPSEIVVLALYTGNEKLAEKIIKDYKVSIKEMTATLEEIKKNGEDPWDMYHSSVFVGLDKEKEINSSELLNQFKKLEKEVSKRYAV